MNHMATNYDTPGERTKEISLVRITRLWLDDELDDGRSGLEGLGNFMEEGRRWTAFEETKGPSLEAVGYTELDGS